MNQIFETEADKLKVRIYKNRKTMGIAAAIDVAERLRTIIAKKGVVNAVFAAAPSQSEFLETLSKEALDWSKVRAFHMDEYIGLDKDAVQGFGNMLREEFFSKLPLKEVNYINGQADDPEKECKRYTEILNHNLPDIVFLGIGENGHLAFNDPAVADFEDPKSVKVVELDSVCRNQQVHDGCFKLFDDVPQRAITLTMSFLISIPEAVVIVPESTKREAVKNTFYGPISTSTPASILRKHNNVIVYADNLSGADLVSDQTKIL